LNKPSFDLPALQIDLRGVWLLNTEHWTLNTHAQGSFKKRGNMIEA
jgi:hypothetical protein